MARKVRSDIKIGNLEKKLGLNGGAVRNPNGSDARSDKKLGTLRDEFSKAKKVKANTPAEKKIKSAIKKSTVKVNSSKNDLTLTSLDQKKASIRIVKSNPRTPSRLIKKVSTALKNGVKK